MRLRLSILSLVAGCCLLLTLPAGAQNMPFFSHDLPGIGLPGSAVNAAPDEADIFMGDQPMCFPNWGRGNNMLIYDNIIDLGLMQGDNIDAWSLLHNIDEQWPFWRFSVDTNTQGLPQTAVNLELPYNTADIFWTDCNMGWNFLCLWDWQIGLACADDLDALDDREAEPDFEYVYFSLTPGSPTLIALGAFPGDVLAVIPRSGMMPFVAVPHWAIGLLPEDNLDALTMLGQNNEPWSLYFSVTQGAIGVPGSGVNARTPLNGADIYWSMINNTNILVWVAPQLGLFDHDELDAMDPDEMPAGPPVKPVTIGCNLNCVPTVGTVPFVVNFTATLNNLYPIQTRRIAARMAVTLANGNYYPNWKSGWANVPPGGSSGSTWNTTIPALTAVIGNNSFQLIAEDVTPMPYNTCPYPPSGDTATSTCIITANP